MNDAEIDHRGLAVFVEGTGVNQRISCISINPIVIHGDVEVPIFYGTVGSEPIGEFVAFAIIVKLFKFHLDLKVVVLTGVGGAFYRECVSGQVERLVHRHTHRNIFTDSISTGRRGYDDTAVVLQWGASTTENIVEGAGRIN